MSREQCLNPQPDCKYSPRCFSDTHHVYGRGNGDYIMGKIESHPNQHLLNVIYTVPVVKKPKKLQY